MCFRFLGTTIPKFWQSRQMLTQVYCGSMPLWRSWGRRVGSTTLPDMPWRAFSPEAIYGCLGRKDSRFLMNFFWMLIGLSMQEPGYGSPVHLSFNSFSTVIVQCGLGEKLMPMETSLGKIFSIVVRPCNIILENTCLPWKITQRGTSMNLGQHQMQSKSQLNA